jgi:hypothetical protein
MGTGSTKSTGRGNADLLINSQSRFARGLVGPADAKAKYRPG